MKFSLINKLFFFSCNYLKRGPSPGTLIAVSVQDLSQVGNTHVLQVMRRRVLTQLKWGEREESNPPLERHRRGTA